MKLIPRLYEWYLACIALLAAIYITHPQDIGVVIYKAALLTFAVVLGLLLEWRFLRNWNNPVASAIVLAAVILGITLGL